MSSNNSTSITLDLPEQLFIDGNPVARRPNIRMHSLFEGSLANAVRDERQRELSDSFTLLGGEAADVEFASDAQAEAVSLGG